MNKKAFTMVELLAVIGVLGLLLAIAIPQITGILDLSKRNAFEKDADAMLRSITEEVIKDRTLDITTINTTNLKNYVKTDVDNYSTVKFYYTSDKKIATIIVGKEKFASLNAYGTVGNVVVDKSIVADGLVLYLDAGNTISYPGTGNTWFDLSGNNIHAQGVNSPIYTTSNSGYFTFTTNKAFNTATSSTLNIINNITLETFIFPTANINVGGIITYGTEAAEQFTFTTMSSQKYMVGTNWPTNWYQVSSGVYTLNAWQHVAATFSSGVWKIYINGALNTTSTIAITNFPSVANSFLSIGVNFPGGDEYLSARLSIARVYNRVLSIGEIQQNYNAQKARYGL